MLKTSGILISAAVACVVAACVVAGSEPAHAQSCAALQAELGTLSGSGGGSGLATARKRLSTLQRQSSANGCRNTKSIGRPRACAGIDSKIGTVTRQIAAFEAKGGGASASQQNRRRRIQAQMASMKCGEAAPARQQARQPAAPGAGARTAERDSGQPRYVLQNNRMVPTARTQGGLISLLFGGGSRTEPSNQPKDAATLTRLQPDARDAGRSGSERGSADDPDGPVTYARHFFGGGSYRTLCVRSCDGYYFPISTVTSRGNFGRDEAVCQSLCPNTEAALYAHTAGSESENMYRVVDGRSYRELETAFRYRKTYDAACSCAFEAKMILTADGKELIDVAASRGAYSPVATSDAAAAIEGIVGPAGAPAAIVQSEEAAAVVEVGTTAILLPASIDASAGTVQTEAGHAVPAADITPAPTAGTAPVPAAPVPATAVDDDAVVGPAAAASTAPRGMPIPDDTPPPLRVRTIGPEFLQTQ